MVLAHWPNQGLKKYINQSINQVYFQATRPIEETSYITNTESYDSNKKTEKLQNCTNYRKKLHIMKPAEIIIINIFIIKLFKVRKKLRFLPPDAVRWRIICYVDVSVCQCVYRVGVLCRNDSVDHHATFTRL